MIHEILLRPYIHNIPLRYAQTCSLTWPMSDTKAPPMNPEISSTKHVARMIASGSGLDILCVGKEREREGKSLTNW